MKEEARGGEVGERMKYSSEKHDHGPSCESVIVLYNIVG
jgi:hypothetical protein